MTVTPVPASPLTMDQLMGAAPRNAGRSEACRFTEPMGGTLRISRDRIWPYATTTDRSAPRAVISSTKPSERADSGSRILKLWSSASSLTADARSSLPLPAGRSGWVTTPTISCPSSPSARREGTAKAGVPQKRILTPSPPPAGFSSTS